MLSRFFVFLSLVVFSVSAYASDDVTEWDLVTDRSQIDISYEAEGYAGHGVLKGLQGDIKFSTEALDKSFVTIHIPMSTLRLDSLEYTRIAKESDWFDLEKHALAVFQASHFEAVEGEEHSYVAKGILTIKGVSQFIDLPFSLKFSEDGEHVMMTSETSIQRSAYQVGVGQWSDTKTVADDVGLKIQVRAVRKK